MSNDARHRRALSVALATVLALSLLAACDDAERLEQEAELATYRAEIESWQQEREEKLRRPDDWLTLVGLHWLSDGPQSLGSDPMSDVVLPAEAPGRVGMLTPQDGTVELNVTPGVGATVGGEAIGRELDLLPAEGDPPTVELGSLRFHAIRRGDWLGLRVRDLESPALAAFTGLDFFPVDPAWRLDARFAPYDPPKETLVDDVTGNRQPVVVEGAVVFEVDGKEHRLDAFDGGEEELFLIFADETSGKETYGAGRYLYVPRPDDTGHLPLDFNRAYNPPCAYTPYATCPLPPKQNRLALAIEAGEKAYH
jgi:hypothetical protein